MTPPGFRGYYEGTDGHAFLQLPRNVDPKQDGTKFAAGHAPIFPTDVAANSVALDDFDKMMESVIPADVLARMDQVINAGVALAARGLADSPPLEHKEWRRGIILSWSHARDLAVILDALGHPHPTANRHDVDEVVLGKHLKERLNSADQWYRDYVEALDDGAWVNVGFFNPHLSASMYKWGDTKTGVQNAMDAHRLAAHHLGNPETPVDWIERAANFVIHHIPREHWGIRHEPRGEYSDLESKMAQDPTMKDSEIGKAIARDVAALCQLLEAEGKIVPWGQLAVPQDALPPTLIEHAFLVQRAGPPLDQNDPHYSEALKQLESARAIISRVPEAIAKAASEGRADLAAAYKRMLGDG